MKSEALRRVHLALFLIISAFMILVAPMKVSLNRNRNLFCETGDFTYYSRMHTIEHVRGAIEIAINIMWFLIIATMIAMYQRYFRPISETHKSRIRDGFK